MRGIKKHISSFILVIGLGFIVYGSYRGEALVVLQKAINICLECIGIG